VHAKFHATVLEYLEYPTRSDIGGRISTGGLPFLGFLILTRYTGTETSLEVSSAAMIVSRPWSIILHQSSRT
jgi:hypothetical protein